MKRRRFLALGGAAVTGIWVAGSGLIRLDRRMVVELSGRCSFCDKTAAETYGLAGVIGRSGRICDECVEICLDILKDDVTEKGRHAPPQPAALPADMGPQVGDDFTITEMLRHDPQTYSKAELERALEELRELLSRAETSPRPAMYRDELACTFCDKRQSAVAKLIAGPSGFICDACSGEAAALLLMHA